MSTTRVLTFSSLVITAWLVSAGEVTAQAAASGCYYSTTEREVRSEGHRGLDYVGASVSKPESVLICPSPDNPGGTPGGGEGGESECSTRPFFSGEEAHAIYQAINAGQTPVSDSPYLEISGTQVRMLYYVACPDGDTRAWFNVLPEGTTFRPQIRAIQLVPALQAQVIRQLPTPIPRIGPADEDENGYAYVQPNDTYFWVDQGPGQWAVVSGSTSAGGISVTVQAAPVRLVVDPGDDSDPVICNGTPPAVTRANYREDTPGCSHTYVNSSAMAPNGETFPVTATVVWHATWSASTGEGGDLGYVSTTSAVRNLPVAEIQAIIVDQGTS